MVRLSPSERDLLAKLVDEAKDTIADIGENDTTDPQVKSKGKHKEAIADAPFPSLMRELRELLEPVEITRRKERSMSKMINNYIRRTLTELAAEIANQKLTVTPAKETALLETNESLPVETQEEEPAFLESNEESSAEETPEADQQQQQARQEQTQVLS